MLSKYSTVSFLNFDGKQQAEFELAGKVCLAVVIA
jgi:hypothetical protein